MGHHINGKGQFQSDKYPELPPDKILLSFKDVNARIVLNVYADLCRDKDPELAADINARVISIQRPEGDDA